jgi:hypothetical protein
MRRGLELSGAIALCALALAGGSAAPAAAGDGPEWRLTNLGGHAGEMFLLNVSCPSTSLCVATGTQNLIASSTNPTGGPAAWHSVFAGEGFYEAPSGSPVISSRQVQGVSCPTTQMCVAVTTLGQIYSTTDPTGPASAWKVVEIPSRGNTHLYGVSCPSASLCVAVSGRRVNTGKVFTSTNPTGGAAAWHVAELGESLDLRAVSCSSVSLCVAAGANGELVASDDPTGGVSAWERLGAPGGPGTQQAISCVAGLCLSGNEGGNLLTSTNPLSASSWRERAGGGSVQITGASCASASACVAVDSNGHVFSSTSPTGDSGAWRSEVLAPYSPEAEEFAPEDPNGLFGASCPSPSFCALVGSGGQIFTSTDPFAVPASPPNGAGPGHARHGPKRPRTTIAKFIPPSPREVRHGTGRVFLRFYANGPVRRFECRVDRHSFHRCRSPERHIRVRNGIHAVRIRAVGLTGLRGPAAVERFWTGHHCTGRGHARSCGTGGGELRPRIRP